MTYLATHDVFLKINAIGLFNRHKRSRNAQKLLYNFLMVPTEKIQLLPTIHRVKVDKGEPIKNKLSHNVMAYCSDNCKILLYKL